MPMKRKLVTIIDDIALSRLQVQASSEDSNRTPGDWIRILRNRLRMTQAVLAKRANITQPNLAAIDSAITTAIVSGVSSVTVAGQTVTSLSLDELRRMRADIKGEIALANPKSFSGMRPRKTIPPAAG